ncbi:MAG TPA: response regulator [Candidatus Pacearchaeota archaeon]|nr:response regulator [Candidatus Pacearchaeota archaeon]HOL90520.1 response regulator [Candidatus Pacearchaeota archaeon]HPO68223.1 response regulator [Candidatus Pacearchaeota archaeon]
MNSKKVLLIEDDLPTVDVYETALKEIKNIEVKTFTLGNEALKEIKKMDETGEGLPDLILLDVILPDINGIEILEILRKQEKTKNIPVLVLTNYGDKTLEKIGNDLKAEKYISKTEFTPSELKKMVLEILEKN